MKFAVTNHQMVNANDAKLGLEYRCPFCHRRLLFHRSTAHHRAYFSHYASGHYDNPGETREHLAGKLQLAQFFKTNANSVKIERYLAKIHQWPDLMVDQTVVEFQCSPISVKTLNHRIAGYSRLGLKSWWLLGSPYQKRHLRYSYLARFINYSDRLGFFILYWRVHSKCLIIHYEIRERGGKLFYQSKFFFNLKGLTRFVQNHRILSRRLSRRSIIKTIRSEMKLSQRRLFHGDESSITLQQNVSNEYGSLTNCPVVCHLPVVTFPIFRGKFLLWKIWILRLLNQSSDLKIVYETANRQLGLPLVFCQIPQFQKLYQNAFNHYVSLLIKHHYIKVDDKKITRLKGPRWFQSDFDKLLMLKRLI